MNKKTLIVITIYIFIILNAYTIRKGGKKIKITKISSSALLMVSAVTPVAYANDMSTINKKFHDVSQYQEEIYYLVNQGVVNGYSDGTFKPNEPITRLQAITILLRELKPNLASIPDVSYNDVKKGDYGYDAISQATALGIVSGKTNGNFDKTGHLTRAQFAKILVEAYKIPLNQDNTVNFTDIGEKHVFSSYITILASHGIVTGYEDGTFKPNESISRAHFSVMLSRFLKNKEETKLNSTPPTSPETPQPNPVDEMDKDGDGLEDVKEPMYGFDPLNPDTDGDGILDGDEIANYTTTVPEDVQTAPTYPTIRVRSAAKEAATIEISPISIDHSILNSAIPGILGTAYSINSGVQFDTAEMQFNYDDSVISEGFSPAIYYYNESTQALEKLPNQVHDSATNTVKTTVNHFSDYVLVDSSKWDKAWEESIGVPVLDSSGRVQLNREIVFTVDSSGSMSSNDSNNIRITASKSFISKMNDKDQAAIIRFSSSAQLLSAMASNKDSLYTALDKVNASGGTNLSRAFSLALEQYTPLETNRIMIFLTDGDGSWQANLIDVAIEKNVKVYTIGLGKEVSDSKLIAMAELTGGKYYPAESADDLTQILEETSEESDLLTKDSDGDGIPDYYETNGLLTGTGEKIMTDPNNPDTDGDGLLDSEEIEFVLGRNYVILHSHPLKVDSDNDGIPDKEEPLADRMK